jgi:hypothetical protein
VSESLNASSFAAGLSPEEKKKIDELRKTLNVHRELSNLPSNVASQVVKSYTPEQQKALANVAGEEDPMVKPKQGWFGSAWDYTGGNVIKAGGQLLKGLNYVSDLSTQAARAGIIAVEEGKPLGTAWTEAGISGEKKFNENRLESARKKYGADAIDVAIRLSSGESPEAVAASATPTQLKYLSLADKTQGTQEERDNFQDALDSVSAAKYSPGRAVANIVDAILPGDLVKNGFLYKGISGFVDAAYRIFADPLLVAGKAKRLYDVQKYALDVVIGNKKVAEVFSEPKVADFWNRYGAELENFRKAKKTGKTNEAVAAERQLQLLAPEFGPLVIKSFNDVDIPISNAVTAKAFFENAKQVDEMMKGSIGRKRVLVPRMDAGRKARIAVLTSANRVFNIDKIGPSLINDTYFGGNATDDGIAQAFIDGKEEIITNVKARIKPSNTARFSTAQISYRLDRFKSKFAIAPLFRDDVFDVTAKDASTQIYRLARTVLPQKESKLIASAFDSIDDTARRKDVFYGLWSTIADARGLNATEPGQLIVRRLTGKGETRFAVTRAGENPAQVGQEQLGLIVSDLSPLVTAPNIVDIDRAAARSTLVQKMLGQANKEWVDKMTGAWSFLTLAGPRYALRNATEDLMVNIAIGQSPWGIAKARLLSTRLNTARGVGKGLTKGEKRASNPLGAALRILNKKEAEGFAKEIAGLDDLVRNTRKEIDDLKKKAKLEVSPKKRKATEDKIKELSDSIKGGTVFQTRLIFARALNEGKLNRAFSRLGRGPLNKEEADLLADQILHGDLDNALADVIEASTNFAVGNDYITSARDFTKKHGVRSVALKIEAPNNYRRAKDATGYKEITLGAQDEASLISWLMRISYYSNDELGALAIANLDNKELAIAKIKQWFKDNPETAKQFRFQTATSQDQHAESIYNAARQIFEKQDPTQLNLDLLNKVRSIDEKTGEYVISGKLSLDDLPKAETDLPRYVVGPQLVAVSDTDNYTSSLMEKGWTWLGLSNARMSREPIVLAEMIRMRQQMRSTGFEDAFIQA